MQIELDEEDLYMLKINCKAKRTVGKANKGINVENIIGLRKLKIKIIKKRKEKRSRKKKGGGRKTAQSYKSPT